MSRPAGPAGSDARLRTAGRIFYALLVILLLIDLALWAGHLYHGHLPIENLPLFGAAAGFLGALGIAGLAKLLGRLFLTKQEDYYQRPRREGDAP